MLLYLLCPWFLHVQNERIRLSDPQDLSSFKILQFYNDVLILMMLRVIVLLVCFPSLPILMDVYRGLAVFKDRILV